MYKLMPAAAAFLLIGVGCDDHVFPTHAAEVPEGGYEATWDGVQLFVADNCHTCHFDGGPGGFVIEDRVEAELLGTATDDGLATMVVPGDADASALWQSVSFLGPASAMPPGGVPLDDEAIGHIETWILDGAAL